jgi:hypothetical protein
MPSTEVLERFIARVESNDHVGAIRDFYAADASMRENQQPPRTGREAQVLEQATVVRSRCVRPVFMEGDFVVIRWVFEFEWKTGKAMRMEELAYQRWDRERIVEEQFFYDPAQLVRP